MCFTLNRVDCLGKNFTKWRGTFRTKVDPSAGQVTGAQFVHASSAEIMVLESDLMFPLSAGLSMVVRQNPNTHLRASFPLSFIVPVGKCGTCSSFCEQRNDQ